MSVRALVLSAALLCAGAAGAAAPGAVPHAVDDEVERHATLGQRHLEQGLNQEAIAEFRRAYELRADPRFLLGIAESYRQLGVAERALFFYDRYLAARPEAPDRDEVEAKILELERARARTLAIVPDRSPAPRLDRDVVIVPIAAGQEGPPAAAGRAPVWRRWWFWTAIGVALAAGVIAAAATAGGGSPAAPATDLGDKRFY